MRILYAVLCETAEGRVDGRVDVTGIFSHLYARGYPAMQDRMMLVAAVEWNDEEPGSIEFSVDILDPTRSPVQTISVQTDVAARAANHPPPRTILVLPLTDTRFPVAGTYTFEMLAGETRTELAVLHQIENPDVG